MIRFYTNRELSRVLDIPLAKWKRWSREFLPPDPLGGLQSGYARQYTPDDTFTVFFGGYLVSAFKYSIPEAKQILADVGNWISDTDFQSEYRKSAPDGTTSREHVQKYQIIIQPRIGNGIGFDYTIREICRESSVWQGKYRIGEIHYRDRVMGGDTEKPLEVLPAPVRHIDISDLFDRFMAALTKSAEYETMDPISP
jgi:hypothetical protein